MKDIVCFGAIVAAATMFSLYMYLILTDAEHGPYITVAIVLAFAVLATSSNDITNRLESIAQLCPKRRSIFHRHMTTASTAGR
jgi:hypothetical protein